MIANKHITKIVAVIMALAVCLCLGAVIFSGQLVLAAGGTGVTMEYETELFDTSRIIDVNIIMDADDWDNMLADAMAEQYYQCDVEINGDTFYRVGIRPKGNTSLSTIANDPDNNRYSLKLEFDQYVDGQTCYGLDKLVLNNNFADATNMKEALIYDMFRYIDADASLYNYAKISVNGEYWGVYLALEAVEDSFLLRNYGTADGELYKPDNMEDNIGGGMRGFSMGGGGSDLNYTDDNQNSYSAIWSGEITNTSESDHKRVVTALKNISQGTNLERYMNVDNLLKYAAVHIFSVNDDSLSGTMTHNYYLYESDGKLNILPWDYNLSLGGMGRAGDTVNSAIDNAFSGTDFFDALLADEEYHAQYYAYMQQLVEEYLLGDGFKSFYERTRSLIDELVRSDPNALYTYEEYENALAVFCEVVTLRGKSIDGQINGTIPSTENEQKHSDALIDASYLDISVMGSMDMGNDRGEFGGFGDNNMKPDNMPGQNFPQRGEQMSENFDPLQSQPVFNMDSFPNNSIRTGPTAPEGNVIIYCGCFALLIAALVFAILFKRKPRKR